MDAHADEEEERLRRRRRWLSAMNNRVAGVDERVATAAMTWRDEQSSSVCHIHWTSTHMDDLQQQAHLQQRVADTEELIDAVGE